MQESIRRQFEKAKLYNKTQLTGLIGSPVAHSSSPKIHEGAFEALGMTDHAYLLFDVPEEETAQAIYELKDAGLIGINITF